MLIFHIFSIRAPCPVGIILELIMLNNTGLTDHITFQRFSYAYI
jgi:hypothetical protein